MAKESFSRAEVKNLKHGAMLGGLVLGAVSLLGIGICIKKTTNANLVDGSTDLFDKAVGKLKEFIDEKCAKRDEGVADTNED